MEWKDGSPCFASRQPPRYVQGLVPYSLHPLAACNAGYVVGLI